MFRGGGGIIDHKESEEKHADFLTKALANNAAFTYHRNVFNTI